MESFSLCPHQREKGVIVRIRMYFNSSIFLGNGPSGMVTSFMLAGNVPYLKPLPEDMPIDEMLRARWGVDYTTSPSSLTSTILKAQTPCYHNHWFGFLPCRACHKHNHYKNSHSNLLSSGLPRSEHLLERITFARQNVVSLELKVRIRTTSFYLLFKIVTHTKIAKMDQLSWSRFCNR